MSKLFIEDTTLTSIGDAIRAKSGTTEKIGPLDMATAIANLPSGGGDKNYTIGYAPLKPTGTSINIDKYITTAPEEDIIALIWAGHTTSNVSGTREGLVVYYPEYSPDFILADDKMDNIWKIEKSSTGTWWLNAPTTNSYLLPKAMIFYKIYN